MKKALLTLSAAALLHNTTMGVQAGDREWAVAGKVLTGVVAASVLARAIEPAPAYYYAAPPVVTVAQPVCQPAPVTIVNPQPAVWAPQNPVVYPPHPTVIYVEQPRVVYRPAPVVLYRRHSHIPFHPPHHHRARFGW